MKKITDNLIMHVYRVERETTDEYVDDYFEDLIREKFLHLHVTDENGNPTDRTYIIRLLTNAGVLVEDGEELEYVYEALEESDELKNFVNSLVPVKPEEQKKIIH